MKRQSSPKTPKTSKSDKTESDNSNLRIGSGRFSFQNGDSYEGKYQLDIGKRTLVKQDQGVYITDNFEVYNGKWSNDKFANDKFHIRYNNNAQYKGNIDASGEMSDTGTYIFPDGSSLTAVWSRNKPVSQVIYKEPLGHEWIAESISDSQISFVTGNHFWNELCRVSSKKDSSSSIQHS